MNSSFCSTNRCKSVNRWKRVKILDDFSKVRVLHETNDGLNLLLPCRTIMSKRSDSVYVKREAFQKFVKKTSFESSNDSDLTYLYDCCSAQLPLFG